MSALLKVDRAAFLAYTQSFAATLHGLAAFVVSKVASAEQWRRSKLGDGGPFKAVWQLACSSIQQ